MLRRQGEESLEAIIWRPLMKKWLMYLDTLIMLLRVDPRYAKPGAILFYTILGWNCDSKDHCYCEKQFLKSTHLDVITGEGEILCNLLLHCVLFTGTGFKNCN